jgi:hypothetical protein
LQSIVIDRLARMKHGDFYKFFCQFATDTVYQYQHIRNPFGFKTEDDYSHETISGIVNAEAWPEYSPDLPTDVLACVLFEDKGQKRASAIWCSQTSRRDFQPRLLLNALEGDGDLLNWNTINPLFLLMKVLL